MFKCVEWLGLWLKVVVVGCGGVCVVAVRVDCCVVVYSVRDLEE